MTGRVAGKKAFITGAARGLGEAAARMLAAEGAKVSLADIDHDGARRVAEAIEAEHGAGSAFAFPLDVTKEDQWIFALEEADAAMGGISVLVNNAGVFRDSDIEHLAFEDWKAVMAVNLDSVFLGAKHALKYMRENQPGSIINICSLASFVAGHNTPSYNASKAGSWMLSKGIAMHCAKQGLDIRSNSIHPSPVDTPSLDPASARDSKSARQSPLGVPGRPEDVAHAVVYLASDESRMMTGAELKLDGGASAM